MEDFQEQQEQCVVQSKIPLVLIPCFKFA